MTLIKIISYTTKVLTDLGSNGTGQIRDIEIQNWVNQTLASKEKSSKISSFKVSFETYQNWYLSGQKSLPMFQDSTISSSMAIIDLIDALVPGSIDYSVVVQDPLEYEDKLQNAKWVFYCQF